MVIVAIFLTSVLVLISIIIAENTITKKRLRENQKAWEEYSKEMTETEKEEVFLDWLQERKLEKGWKHYYIPKMKGAEKNEKRRISNSSRILPKENR